MEVVARVLAMGRIICGPVGEWTICGRFNAYGTGAGGFSSCAAGATGGICIAPAVDMTRSGRSDVGKANVGTGGSTLPSARPQRGPVAGESGSEKSGR